MLTFYDIGIRLYHSALRIASFFNPKALQWLEGRQGLIGKIEAETAGFSGRTLWVHCASLGEFEMARPIMQRLRQADPSQRIVLTFFSPSGYGIRKNYEGVDHVFYIPLDTAANAVSFIKAIRPSTVIFVKYDLWFHHLNEAKKHGASLLLISAQFRPSQQYFKFYGTTARKALQLFDRIFLVDKDSEELLRQIDVKNTIVCGDTRYDRVMEVAEKAETIAAIASFKGNSKLIVCGSTWAEDEKLLLNCIDKLPNVKWVIAPHEVDEANLKRLESLLCRSDRLSAVAHKETDVLLVDSIGMLNRIYRYADVAYVGGGFRTGLHNILEATAFGAPTVFGPHHSRFPDAGQMVEKGLAFSIRNENELKLRLEELLMEEPAGLRADIIAFMKSRMGATDAITEYISKC